MIAVLCFAPLCALAQPASAPGSKPALTVSLVAPQRGDWPQRLPANGNITAWQEAVSQLFSWPSILVDDIGVGAGAVSAVKFGQRSHVPVRE